MGLTNRRNFLEKSSNWLLVYCPPGNWLQQRGAGSGPQAQKKQLHILMRSSWGSDGKTDPASFVFSHGLALADAGRSADISPLEARTPCARRRVMRSTDRMASPERDHGEGCSQTASHCLWSSSSEPRGCPQVAVRVPPARLLQARPRSYNDVGDSDPTISRVQQSITSTR